MLNKLWKRRSEFDAIVIETTGLAAPGPIISSFYLDNDLPDRVRLDGIVTVVRPALRCAALCCAAPRRAALRCLSCCCPGVEGFWVEVLGASGSLSRGVLGGSARGQEGGGGRRERCPLPAPQTPPNPPSPRLTHNQHHRVTHRWTRASRSATWMR